MTRWAPRALGVVLVAMSASCSDATSAGDRPAASCVGPYLDDQPAGGPLRASTPTVRPGEAITVHGHWYTATCSDTGEGEPPVASEPVRLTLTLPDGSVVELGEFEPHGRDLGFSATVSVPAGTPPGTAIVSDDRTDPATFELLVNGQRNG